MMIMILVHDEICTVVALCCYVAMETAGSMSCLMHLMKGQRDIIIQCRPQRMSSLASDDILLIYTRPSGHGLYYIVSYSYYPLLVCLPSETLCHR